MENIFLEGLLLQASLILALGAQNLFVLEAGMRRQHHLTVSFVCFLCDFLLIMLGVAGAASLFTIFPKMKILVGVIGIAFMLHYGLSKIFNEADTLQVKNLDEKNNLKRSIVLAITFSILNPHAYLDAFILIGGFSSKYSSLLDRMTLGLGAAVFSGIWFVFLSSASSVVKPLFENPKRMRGVMVMAGVCLVVMSGKLSTDVYSWIYEAQGQEAFAFKQIRFPASPGLVFSSILF